MRENTPIAALGLMSGTSLDGVDGAICFTDGERLQGFGQSYFRPYTKGEQETLRAVLNSWPEDGGHEEAHDIVLNAHLEVIEHFPEADVVGFHGQTLNHDPKGGRSFQLGDGDRLAQMSGKTIAWDFRTKDMELGGQGAPLAPFFHFACAKTLGLHSPVAFVNLGGVGNVSFIDPSKFHASDEGALISFDTGPANAPINDLMMERKGAEFDQDGIEALGGRIDQSILEAGFKSDFFETTPPKSLDRNDFSNLNELVKDLDTKDAAASLTAFAVAAVYAAQMHFPEDPFRWLICGGGRKNPAIMNGLRQRMDAPVDPVETVGFDGDMFEAQAFAYLAVRVLRDLPISSPGTTGASEPVIGGKISGSNNQ